MVSQYHDVEQLNRGGEDRGRSVAEGAWEQARYERGGLSCQRGTRRNDPKERMQVEVGEARDTGTASVPIFIPHLS